MSELAVDTRGLTKLYGKQTVVDAIDLAVPYGSVYGFLGPNGSGKTTTIRMLLGLIEPSAGSQSILGHDNPFRALPRVGALVEGPAFHPYLSGKANLRRLDAMDGSANPATSATRIGAALERVGLLAVAGKKYRQYSLGMRQRLAIAAALLMPRDLLILDEPTNGLDPQGTREIRSLISSLAADGTTIVVSSHLLSEIEQICSAVGVISAGRLVAQGEIDTLRADQQTVVVVHTKDTNEAFEVLTRHGLTEVTVAKHQVRGVATAEHRGEDLVAALVTAGVGVAGFALERPSLEDLFVELTGEGFDVAH